MGSITGTVPVLATSLEYGLDADKVADPEVGEVYLASDTERVYLCFVPGLWTDLTLFSELRLIPKESSSGPEGTVFYDSIDKCLYVGVEV